MKVVHVRVDADVKVVFPASLLARLPKKVALFTTAQLLHAYEDMSSQLLLAKREVVRVRTPHTRTRGQLLGCNVQSFGDYAHESFDAVLFVGDGLFHPQALLWKNDVQLFLYNPFSGEERVIDEEGVLRARKRYEAALSTFRQARVVGVLIPHKPGGQLYLRWALELPSLYPDKTFVNLIDYNIDFQGLENFPFCEVFVNAACPRIPFEDASALPRPVVNLEDVSESFYRKQLSTATTPDEP